MQYRVLRSCVLHSMNCRHADAANGDRFCCGFFVIIFDIPVIVV